MEYTKHTAIPDKNMPCKCKEGLDKSQVPITNCVPYPNFFQVIEICEMPMYNKKLPEILLFEAVLLV